MARRFQLKRLTDFVNTTPCEDYIYQTKISDFLIRCPNCNSTNLICRGWRRNKRKGAIRIYSCKDCGRKFSDTFPGHLPLHIVSDIFDLAVRGMAPRDIAEIISKRYGSLFDVSPQTIMNIIKQWIRLFQKFEDKRKHRLNSEEWQIDDTPQIFPKSTKNSRCIWITNVLAVEPRYWLSAYVSEQRTEKASILALELAYKRAKYGPVRFRCDGYKGHKSAIHKVFPFAMIDSKSKEEDFGHINLIESLHSFIRRSGIKKRGRFRSIENLQAFLELVRVYHNFLRPHGAIGTTPAARVGIAPMFSSWNDLLRYVHRHLK